MEQYQSFDVFERERLDYLVLRNYSRYFGRISNSGSEAVQLSLSRKTNTLKASWDQICEMREAGVVKQFVHCDPVPRWLRGFERMQDPPPIGLFLHSSGPVNLFPQLGIGFLSNPDLLIYGGAQAGVSGPVLTSGWYYAQLSLFAKMNIGRINYWRIFVGYGFAHRASDLISDAYCGCDKNSPDYFSGTLNTKQEAGSHLISFGLRYERLSFEIGAELKQYVSASPSFSGAITPGSEPEQLKLRKTEELDNLTRINRLSIFYYSVTLQLL